MKWFLCCVSLLLLFLTGCTDDPLPLATYTYVSARDPAHTPLYRLQIPADWKVNLPKAEDSLTDTTKPLCTCMIDDIEITIHNFDLKISPEAQTTRWTRQFDTLSLEGTTVGPQAFSGFVGLKFYAKGILKKKETAVLAWAMQISPELSRILDHPRSVEEKLQFDGMAYDFTIKAIGSPVAIEKHKVSIIASVRSFELIQAIPYRP